MAKSSINFKKASGHSSAHNMRIDEPHYLLPKEHRLENEYWQNSKSDKELFELELKNSKPKGGPKPKLENSRWEAVLNLNKNHSLEDVQKVAEHIAKKFNITPTEITIHRDEGRIENGKPVYNFHAHLNFLTYKDGKQNWRKELIKPAALSELQTDVAKLLNMERGKVNSKAKRLDHRQYKAVAQAMQYNFREMQKRITALETLTTEQKKELHRLNSHARKDDTKIQELERKLEDLTAHKNAFKYIAAELQIPVNRDGKYEVSTVKSHIQEVKNTRQELKIEREEQNALQEQVSALKNENVSLRSNLSVLEQEKKELKQEVSKLREIVDKVSSFFSATRDTLVSRVTSFFKSQSETPSPSSPPLERSDIEVLFCDPDIQAQKNAGERIKDLMSDLDEVKRLKI